MGNERKIPRNFQKCKIWRAAKSLMNDALKMLNHISDQKWLKLMAKIGIWKAKKDSDDVILYEDNEYLETFCFLRQQTKKDKYNLCLSDYVSEKKEDYIGAFICTAGLDIEKQLKIFESDLDDYNCILLKSLADRLAEGFDRIYMRKFEKKFGHIQIMKIIQMMNLSRKIIMEFAPLQDILLAQITPRRKNISTFKS